MSRGARWTLFIIEPASNPYNYDEREAWREAQSAPNLIFSKFSELGTLQWLA